MFRNLTGFPIRFGSPDAAPIPSDGTAKASSSRPTQRDVLVLPGDRMQPGTVDVGFDTVTGLPPEAEQCPDDITIVSAQVAHTMIGGGTTIAGQVWSPGIVTEKDGVRFATSPVRHIDAEIRYR